MVVLSNKGQVTIEFMITIIFILAVFVFGVFIFQQRSDLNFSSLQSASAQEISFRVAKNINAAFLLDDNSSISDSLYWTGLEKSVSVNGQVVQVWYSGSYSSAPILNSNLVWSVSDINGTIYFKKVNGRVVVDYS